MLADDPLLRADVARFDVDAMAFRAMSERFIDELKAGQAHPAQPSMMKYAGTELNKARHELVMAAGGSNALEWESDRSQEGQGGARMAADQGQFDRGRHQRGPARHRRQAHPRTAGSLIRCRSISPTTRRCCATRRAASWPSEGAIAKQLRHWRDKDCKDGFGHDLWKQFAEMGFTGILIDEADGGLGLGHVEAGIVLEEIGRNLTPSPFLTSAVAVVEALKGTALTRALVPRHPRRRDGRGAGDRRRTEAPARGDRDARRALGQRLQAVGPQAVRRPGRVGGRDPGRGAGRDDGLTLFAVEKDANGLEVEGVRLVDSSIGARMTFDECRGRCRRRDRRGRRRRRRCSTRVLDAGRAGAAAELVGVGAAAMDMTVDYLKQRKQFGRLIGEFQALQHRAAHLYSELEIARAATLKAQQLLDEGGGEAEAMVSVAKAKAGRAVAARGAGRRADARRHRHDRRI